MCSKTILAHHVLIFWIASAAGTGVLLAQATTRVSVDSQGGQGDANSKYDFWPGGPAMSADGRFIAFCSGASNLVPGDTEWHYDIFVHDRQTGETTRVSVDSQGAQANSDSA